MEGLPDLPYIYVKYVHMCKHTCADKSNVYRLKLKRWNQNVCVKHQWKMEYNVYI